MTRLFWCPFCGTRISRQIWQHIRAGTIPGCFEWNCEGDDDASDPS